MSFLRNRIAELRQKLRDDPKVDLDAMLKEFAVELRQYAAAFGPKIEDDNDFNNILWEVEWMQGRREARQRIAEGCANQPAGVPMMLPESMDIEVALARGYEAPIKRSPRRKLKPEERKERRKKIRELEARMARMNEPKGKLPTLRQWIETTDYIFYRKERDRDGYGERRRWYSEKLGCTIVIMEHFETKKCRMKIQRAHEDNADFKASLYLRTWNAASAYTVETESRALEMLKSKVTDEQFSRYFCTGFLVERSKKSRLLYIFRRLRPILVFRETLSKNRKFFEHKFIAALCIHAQGYYNGTWAGTLVPTDDLVAQLLMMRCNEKELWRRATKHSKHSPSSDI